MGVNFIALLWGFAEATLFFIVPDVWLSVVGRERLRSGLLACLYSLAGAMLGGVVMYLWGRQDLSGSLGVVEMVPAISMDTILRVHKELTELGGLAVMLGPLSGTPYKVYAVQASDAGIGLWLFMFITVPGRLIRFMLVTAFCHYVLKGTARWRIGQNPLMVLLTGWTLFYLFYFSVTSS